MTTTTWNIWSIKNRWLRAAVAWPLVFFGGVALAVVFVAAAVVLGVIGAGKGAYHEVRQLWLPGWGEIGRMAWRAMTAKESE